MQVSVQLERVGKPQPADRVATSSSAGIQECRNLRLFVTDKNTGLRFLVDSGADISIIPPKDKNRMPSSDYKLYAANGTEIVTYGKKVRNLDIGLRRQFQWPFVIANINRAIIGADFLNNFGLIIDIKIKRLIDGITNLSIRSVIQSISHMGNISTLNSSSKVSAILTKYPNLCRPPSDFVEAKHSVKHYIPTRGQPIHSKARRLDSQRLTFAKAEFQYMLNNGIFRPSNSPWASPLHLVSKKNESLRPCGDYRRLNAVTLPDRYPIPRLDDFHHILKGTRVYSKIDLCKAFYQIPIAEEDKPKTAIITPFGLFEFNVMSFGLRNATATFQRFMHEVLRNLDFAFVYLDDILVASKTEEEHYSHLETLFSRLNSYGLRINLSKSKFLVQEIDFLGYLITSHGVKPLPTKVKAILEYKKPKTVHELRIFLGMLNFYRTFLNNAAETQAILHEYLRGAKKKDRSEIKWTKEAEVQFEKCKQALANTALLAYPDTELPISLCTDASNRAVGSVLQQLDNNNWKPIPFFSKKLNPAQCNYSTYDRELLAIYLSIKFFKHLLEAREFTILTDHKPLIYAFKQKNEKASPRQLRHLQYISQFSTDIKYIKGTDNIVADALSKVDAITTIDYEEIAKEQTGDSELQNLISKNTSLKFKQCPLQSVKLLWCDVSTNNIRPFIPIKFRMMVFRNFHELSHPGIKATTKQLTSRFIWPNMNKDIRKWAQACVNCQKCKVSIHTKSEIGKYQEVDERFSVVHIDLIGPLPPSNGNIYCLTCIDRYTSWMEVVPLPDMKSETVARAFYENWIVRFGAPHTVISDRGKQFTSQLFKDLTTLCGIKLRHSTAYHPQCNGKIERLHRTIKTAIRAHNNIKWTETLPTVLLGLRAAINKDNNHFLSQMVYGKTIRLPGEFFDDSKHHLHAEEFVQQLQKQMELLKPLNEKHHSKTKVFVHKDLKTCSHVFIRTDRVKKPLEPPYEGPFPVLERTDKYFTLKVKGKNVTTSIDRLRPAYLLADSDNITAEHPTATRPIVSGALPSTSSQKNPDPPDVEKYTEFQGTGSAPDLPRTRSGRIIKKPMNWSRFCQQLFKLSGFKEKDYAILNFLIINENYFRELFRFLEKISLEALKHYLLVNQVFRWSYYFGNQAKMQLSAKNDEGLFYDFDVKLPDEKCLSELAEAFEAPLTAQYVKVHFPIEKKVEMYHASPSHQQQCPLSWVCKAAALGLCQISARLRPLLDMRICGDGWLRHYIKGFPDSCQFTSEVLRNLSCSFFDFDVCSILQYYVNSGPSITQGIEEKISHKTNIGLFADDIILWSSNTNWKKAERDLNKTLLRLEKFANKHKLEFNPQKSEICLFTTDKKLYKIRPNIILKEQQLQYNKHPKYLGYTLDPEINSKYLKQLSLEIINKIPKNAITIYTDGSRDELGHTGSGSLIKTTNGNEKINRRNPEFCSVFRSELIAIYEVLKSIRNIKHHDIWILTDSRSAIQHLSHTGELRDKVSRNIIGYLQKLSIPQKFTFNGYPYMLALKAMKLLMR
ncbi:hypothetical protein LAZ67_3002563 [Cordylochernes scorpioides]|uniref:RNA-directed DNA polymerase n=1 Tax=Cordylochernes scorpioides TaxID=51811 RepID=A0ABY6K8Q4_9ARAC|nr:hypothetical protein LAZ67_3002563 [Cordylochernes scorpioides]